MYVQGGGRNWSWTAGYSWNKDNEDPNKSQSSDADWWKVTESKTKSLEDLANERGERWTKHSSAMDQEDWEPWTADDAMDTTDLPPRHDGLEWDETPEPFGGAASSSCAPRGMIKCGHCGNEYAVWSMLAYVNADDKKFVKQFDPAATKAKQKALGRGESFKQSGTSVAQVLTCVECCEKFHNTKYMTETGGLKAIFRNATDLSKGRKLKGKKMTKFCNTIDGMVDDCEKPRLIDVMDALREAGFAKATDWVTEFAPGCYVIYGCRACNIHPMKNGSWYFMSNATGEGGTTEGKSGFWVCANCAGRFSFSESGPTRLFCLPLNEGRGFMLAYWGDRTESENAKFSQYITILKGCTLYKEMEGTAITYENILAALESLTTRNEINLIKRLGTEVVKYKESVDVSKFSTRIYCEDLTLSIPRAGTRFAVFDVDLYKEEIPYLTTEELMMMLDECSRFYDLSTFKTNGPSDRRMIRDITHRTSGLAIGTR